MSSSFTYDRDRLLSATVSGAVASCNYDAFGRLETVTGGGKVVERNTYDGFDHVVQTPRLTGDGGQSVTQYAFDPFDRTTSKTGGGKTTTFNYLGLSAEVLSEEVAGAVTASYQYSPWGERLSQLRNPGTTPELGVYGYNARGDVETVTTTAGDTSATYGYTAYGKDEAAEFTGREKADPDDPAKDGFNPYRYNAKRWDVSSGTYDMGFRDYKPELNRFTTRDMYNGALADMRLGADPLTGNRYAFTGGNPVGRVELDGHEPDCMGYNSFTCPRMNHDEVETPSGPGEWGNGWQLTTDDTPSTESDEPAEAPAPAPAPKPIPVWENFLGGMAHTLLTGFTQGGSDGGSTGICAGIGGAPARCWASTARTAGRSTPRTNGPSRRTSAIRGWSTARRSRVHRRRRRRLGDHPRRGRRNQLHHRLRRQRTVT
ncbi:RHS repeat-associated core domain-containing protein [Streptomyces sp. NPDC051742]|uniref:RHS repeat-associated core domain-containing protein n=1 Tax=unclassified Streptomyces TaxID=2593676 RepID=UPI003447C3BC